MFIQNSSVDEKEKIDKWKVIEECFTILTLFIICQRQDKFDFRFKCELSLYILTFYSFVNEIKTCETDIKEIKCYRCFFHNFFLEFFLKYFNCEFKIGSR